eukprot:1246138-Amphidinium_carterae.1
MAQSLNATLSKPVFKAKAKEFGIPDEHVAALVNQGIDSLSKFAFASSYQPGVSADDVALKT